MKLFSFFPRPSSHTSLLQNVWTMAEIQDNKTSLINYVFIVLKSDILGFVLKTWRDKFRNRREGVDPSPVYYRCLLSSLCSPKGGRTIQQKFFSTLHAFYQLFLYSPPSCCFQVYPSLELHHVHLKQEHILAKSSRSPAVFANQK